MNTHPDHEDILAALDADGGDATRAHVEGCPECSTVADRLRAGRGLIDLARAHEPTLDWSRMEARLEAEAEKVAADIRAGALRPPSRLRSAVAAGVMVSMAAAAVLYVGRGREAPPARPPVVAHRSDNPAPAPTLAPPESARVEARVLLAAGGATVSTADSSTARLSAVSTLVEGVTLAAGEHGRAVVSLRPGWSLDVRPGATANLRRLREDETVVALSGGEARVEPGSNVGEDPGVSLRSGRWTVTAHGPATVRDEVSTLRVVVLAGRATFEAEGAEPMQVTGPVIFDLPATGDPRAVQGEASDPAAIALSALNALGELAVLPPVSLNATVSFTDGGALPAALEAVRVMGPTTIQAREAGRLSRLEIGTGRVLRWTPVGATVAAAAPRPRVTAPPPAAPDPVQVAEEQRLRAWTGAAVRRIGNCFTRCRETNRCPDASGFIELVVSPNRAPVTVGGIDPAFANARACVEGQAPSIPRPDVSEAHTVRIPIHGTQR